MSKDEYNSEVKRLEFLLSVGEISEAKFEYKLDKLDEKYNRENPDDESDYCEPVRLKANEPGMEVADSPIDRTW
jgi:hypothetical protein